MSRYTFNDIYMSHKYAVSFFWGPLIGSGIGFCITLSKSPPCIAMDSIYGAFLGILLVIAYNLFLMSLTSGYEHEDEDEDEHLGADLAKIKKALAQVRELDQDRERLRKNHVKNPNAPISSRTRSQT
jgi:hypothetical protein